MSALIAALQDTFVKMNNADGGAEEAEYELIFGQLMRISLVSDYSDEHGRLNMIEFLSMLQLYLHLFHDSSHRV